MSIGKELLRKARNNCVAVIGDGAGPTGIPYTVLADDVRAMHPRRPEVEAPLLGGLAGGDRAVVGSDAW